MSTNAAHFHCRLTKDAVKVFNGAMSGLMKSLMLLQQFCWVVVASFASLCSSDLPRAEVSSELVLSSG
eukprot:4807511-Amphidinium_carterae.1